MFINLCCVNYVFIYCFSWKGFNLIMYSRGNILGLSFISYGLNLFGGLYIWKFG